MKRYTVSASSEPKLSGAQAKANPPRPLLLLECVWQQLILVSCHHHIRPSKQAWCRVTGGGVGKSTERKITWKRASHQNHERSTNLFSIRLAVSKCQFLYFVQFCTFYSFVLCTVLHEEEDEKQFREKRERWDGRKRADLPSVVPWNYDESPFLPSFWLRADVGTDGRTSLVWIATTMTFKNSHLSVGMRFITTGSSGLFSLPSRI